MSSTTATTPPPAACAVLKAAGLIRQSLSQDRLYAVHGETDFGNPAWGQATSRFLVVRLSAFADVERSTPHLLLVRELRHALPNAYIDFGFLPGPRDRVVLNDLGLPLLHGIASARGAAEFDYLLVSNAFALELVNLPLLLLGSGIAPLRSTRDRQAVSGSAAAGQDSPPRPPLIILGGSNVFASAAIHRFQPATAPDAPPICADSLVDAVFFGEGEGHIGTLAVGLAAVARADQSSRLATLDDLADSLPGFWHSRRPQAVTQARSDADHWLPVVPPRLAGAECGTVRLEITRGCPSFCTFCFEGWERKPYRERSVASIMAEAAFLKHASAADTVELASYNFNAHSRIVEIIERLHGLFHQVNFMSQRADILAAVPNLVDFEVAAGKRSFTVGVEGISARLRAFYNKELTEAQLLEAVSLLLAAQAREIKFFYIVSGRESAADLAEFGRCLERITALRTAASARSAMLFSVGTLIRMPRTPLALDRVELDQASYQPILRELRRLVEAQRFDFREPGAADEYGLSQALTLPGPDSLKLLLTLAERGHAYDRSLTKGAWALARKLLDVQARPVGQAIPGDQASPGAPPPGSPPPDGYGFVTSAVERRFLERRFQAADQYRAAAACFGGLEVHGGKPPASGPGTGETDCADCAGCAACLDDAERSSLTDHRIIPPTRMDIERLQASLAAKRRPTWLTFRDRRPARLAAAPDGYCAADFATRLLAARPDLAENYLRAEEVFPGGTDWSSRLPEAHGDALYRLGFRSAPACAGLAVAGFCVVPEDKVPERFGCLVSFGPTANGSAPALPTLLALTADYLKAADLAHTLRRTQDGAEFTIAAKSLAKKKLLACRLTATGGGIVGLHLELGVKADLAGLVSLARRRGLSLSLETSLPENGPAKRSQT
ncbi:MAG: hypothetical protein A2087_13775 [Spirochaetes bacterium GWD1_61_31]|nr:MAG: hypothetical protein A2Y37_10300 [Spirochaetes bacterium GWB1_60_80]OHD33749.1 MAG: hypothetical protein A2004_09570 [Spirochaetes bacterium GWC1_61_12]OHD38972.1 MAG: hypothetical protein A2087_13775 [Spirochaetes bacterium GWD1_61_31]OHD43422.1 MAG: hypothetical protein A2Y35_11670 [Spirochaetes bacterium GWE1_60_18]OHD58953.1 MAG: hypothetical protein A2Y32_10460 [Spirochaetes bacterium GWF1_60_12]